MASVTLPAGEASRVLWNATLFSSNHAEPMKDEVYIATDGHDFVAVGADRYSAGADLYETVNADPTETAEVFLSIKTAKALERSLRARGEAIVTLGVSSEGIEYDEIVHESKQSKSLSGWLMIRKLLRPGPVQGFGNYLEVDAKRLAQFGSVKTKGDYPLSLYVQSERVWQVKIGPTFRGLICPLDRATLVERYAEQADEVMWGINATVPEHTAGDAENERYAREKPYVFYDDQPE